MAGQMMRTLRRDVARTCYRNLRQGNIVQAVLALRYLVWIVQAEQVVQKYRPELEFLMWVECHRDDKTELEAGTQT